MSQNIVPDVLTKVLGEQVMALAGQVTYDLLAAVGARFDAGIEAGK